MVGISLPYDLLNGKEGLLGDYRKILEYLKKEDVKSIELRTVRAHHNPDDVLCVSNMLWAYGFDITVHSSVTSVDTAISDVFGPLKKLLSNLKQPKLNITIHPIVGDNVAMLTKLSDHCIKNNYPVVIALENNRKLPDKTEGNSAALVLDIVKKVARENVGICFDFGHYMYYLKKNEPDRENIVPDTEFLRKVVHTHIHALNDMTTHFPLGLYDLPLKQIVDELDFEYTGIYNIELEFERFENVCEPFKALEASIKTLKENIPFCAYIYKDVRENFDSWMSSALKTFEGCEKGTKFGLIHSSSYVFNTNGFKWGMDISFRKAFELATLPHKSAELLGDMDLMIISHGHRDHFEEAIVKILANTNVKWLIPDFLVDKALEFGVLPEKMYVAHENEELKIGELTILPFKSRHFRPVTNSGLDEYGYHITAENSPSMVFPVDIRNFSVDNFPKAPKADYCFANVWLGDAVGFEDDFSPKDDEYAEFMLKFSDKKMFLTHLYENGRPAKYIWTDRHAEIVKRAIHKKSPETVVYIPKAGEIFKL